ncbi:MAG: thermonuclease family protein [Sedimentisphaerales bacterium]|nr:thermonuclease family protein [Sedimentisphaerales bacterium]
MARKLKIKLVFLPLSRRNRHLLKILAALIVAALILSDRLDLLPQSVLPDHKLYHDKTFTVIRVIDGDTLDIDTPDPIQNHPTTRIRLWGVDTPETKHPKFGKMYFGPEAAKFTEDLTLNQPIRVVLEPFEKSRDKYQRLLAYIYLPDDSSLNEKLLAQGYAYADERFSHMFRKKFLELQKQAQRQKLGLWKNVQPQQFPPWYRKIHDPQYQP